jgi:hypothetical protein
MLLQKPIVCSEQVVQRIHNKSTSLQQIERVEFELYGKNTIRLFAAL